MGGDDRTFRANFSSEGVSRLRGVVEEKLKEFMGDYTDDTLVEYVIVLLKNGRSRDEAKNELDVFLGDDSDSFISWLWDHLGSNLSLYVQAQELEPVGVPKAEPAVGDQPRKTGSHQIESEADKQNSVETYGHHKNRENKGLVRGGNDEVSLPLKSVANNVNSRDENKPSDSQSKPLRFPQSTIHKKRRRNDEGQQQRKRDVSQSTVSAPKRLLQFAVRDAVATSRPSNATAEPSFKRLRSVVSTTDSYAEARPQRIHRASMSVAIKAMAEAVKDVTKVRPSRNVFDRLGNAMDGLNTSSHREYGGIAEGAIDGDFNVEMESLHSSYHLRNDISMLQEGNMSSFHEEVRGTGLGYDRENCDERGGEGTDIYPSGSSGGNWVESSLKFQYGAADHVDGTPHRSRKEIIQPAVVHNAILINSSAVSMKMRKSQYQGEVEAAEIDSRERMRGADTVSTKSEAWLMKENNNHTVPFNGNAKPDATLLESERSQTPSGLRNTGAPTEDADSRTIFVSNVHFAATKDSLSRHFNKFGEVLKVIILTDPATGQPKGSAYIEFMRKEAAELALSLDGTSFLSRILKIVKKSSAQPDAASVMTWPRVARASFVVPRYGRAPFTRGMPSLYRGRVPMKPGARSFQWKRGADSTVTETSGQASNSMISSPTTRSLTYVRAETKTNGSSGTA
ncbi:uncharacterized protein LOC131014141 [Salvia miltiorrhiza]|uniref:uncharacterized protein LOC131014141 n=1 Tax=Salvia miltiorrhiza TaxID=226208 RepID=UPI0025AD8CAB|nr:uncharacterized protein LOC131014141 [Salvia miltiorrhiza]